ncbi:MAG: hypothetical protein GX113_02845 [Actinobacteria bacterium]|jgi:uncharacterized protein YceK|nr:hypothetical protein [Actinomycetota bacterium]
MRPFVEYQTHVVPPWGDIRSRSPDEILTIVVVVSLLVTGCGETVVTTTAPQAPPTTTDGNAATTGGNAATSSTVEDEATAQSVIDLAESTEAALAKDAAGTIAAINAGDERFTDPVRPDITGRL